MTHLTSTFGESPNGKCRTCGAPVILICAPTCWDVDRDSYRELHPPQHDDEDADDDDDVIDSLEIDAEVTGHWCETCGEMTSISFNQS